MSEQMRADQASTIRQVLPVIEARHVGTAVVVDADEVVVGIITDGDIRRHLMAGGSVDDAVSLAMNRNFVSVQVDTARENILKLLDNRIKLVPVLDAQGRLVRVVDRTDFPLSPESSVYARCRAPVRISFGGGGTDLTHYFVDHGGAVINSSISIYCHATLRPRGDAAVRVYSHDMRETLEAGSLDEALAQRSPLVLIQSILRVIRPEGGFELSIGSEFPVGSGLGGSSTVCAAVIGAFNELRRDPWDRHEIAEIAFQAERLAMGVSGGWQDQYAAVFGGFNFMEFTAEQNVVQPLRIPANLVRELEECLVLCHTGVSRESDTIHKDQKATMKAEDVRALVDANKRLTYQIRNSLLRGRLIEVGRGLHEGWMLKRQLSSKISNGALDDIYDAAIASGAAGGKLLGAGGGGFFLFYVEPGAKYAVVSALEARGLGVRPFLFDEHGVQSWKMRASLSTNGEATA